MSDFHNQSTNKSRKRRKCCCTGAIIEPGDRYVRYSGRNEGDFYSEVVHAVVAPIYDRHNAMAWEDDGEALMFGDLLDSLSYYHEVPQAMAECETVAALPGVPGWFAGRVAEWRDF